MAKLRRYFITGLVALLPLSVTAFIAWFFISKLGALGGTFLKYIPGIARLPHVALTLIGFIILIAFIIGVGAITSGLFGRWFFSALEKFFSNLPFVKGIYTSTRQLTDAVLVDQKSLKQVVLVEYPRRGIYTVGFVTYEKEIDLGSDKKGSLIFLPSTPNPTTGWLIIIPSDEVYRTNLSVDEGIKMVVSGGVVTPEKLKKSS
jgi:uncharacterized membrane protein